MPTLPAARVVPPAVQPGTPLTAPLPDYNALVAEHKAAQTLADPARILRWVRDLVAFLERSPDGTRPGPCSGPGPEHDPGLDALVDTAADWVTRLTDGAATDASASVPAAVRAEAHLVRGDLRASGVPSFTRHIRKSQRRAFADYERAVRGGCVDGWARIGRDYEGLHDDAHACAAYEQGAGPSASATARADGGVVSENNSVACEYRVAMACLLGELGMLPDHSRGLALLRAAADHATLACPHPAYVYGMVLAHESSALGVPPEAMQAAVAAAVATAAAAPTSTPRCCGSSSAAGSEAAHYLVAAAYLHCAPAQLKLGWAYEHAQLEQPYDPLLSVQYYTLAAQAGLAEADLALSRWFLCGAPGCLGVDEALAYQFAAKAAPVLALAQFAMGYYNEVGVGCAADMASATAWYTVAAQHGNIDAQQRLAALRSDDDRHLHHQHNHRSGPGAVTTQGTTHQSMSRQKHQHNISTTTECSRTSAAQRTIARRHRSADATARSAVTLSAPTPTRTPTLAPALALAPAPAPAPTETCAALTHVHAPHPTPSLHPTHSAAGASASAAAAFPTDGAPMGAPTVHELESRHNFDFGYSYGASPEPLRREQTLSMPQAAGGGGSPDHEGGDGGESGGWCMTTSAPNGVPAASTPRGTEPLASEPRTRPALVVSGSGPAPGYASRPRYESVSDCRSGSGCAPAPATWAGSSTSATGVQPCAPAGAVKYDTFAAMGFEPQKQAREDCVVM